MSKPSRAAATPESYVVRVYRRDARAPSRIAGTVEVVASGHELGFTGLRELQAIFTAPSGQLARSKR